MPSLRELQLEFCAGVRAGNAGRGAQWVVGAGIDPAQRMQIYGNNSRLGFLAAMRASFPVIARLGGDDWFAQSVRGYQQRHPSRCGDLQYVGDRYADHLAAELADTAYEYFSDVARLEWTYQEVLTAAPGGAFDAAALRAIEPADHERIAFEPRPDLRLVDSAYPLLTIWQANQPGAPEDAPPLRLDAGEQSVLLIRRADHVELRMLSAGTAALLRQFVRGAALGVAAGIAEQSPDFDLPRCLQELISMQTIAAIHIDEATP